MTDVIFSLNCRGNPDKHNVAKKYWHFTRASLFLENVLQESAKSVSSEKLQSISTCTVPHSDSNKCSKKSIFLMA